MIRIREYIYLALAISLVACVREPMEANVESVTPQSKIVACNAEPARGMLLVRMSEYGERSMLELEEAAGVALHAEAIFPASTRSHSSVLDSWYLLCFDKSEDVERIAERVATLESVEVVEYERVFKPTKSHSAPFAGDISRSTAMPTNDTYLGYQWHYHNDGSLSSDAKEGADINLFNAWNYTAGDPRVIVAVIDGGIMTDHPDIVDNLWVNEAEKNGLTGIDDDGNGYIDDVHGYNFVWDKGEITPDSHGTHTAGTIGAVSNNGIGVSGIAGGTGVGDGVRLMSMQIFDDEEGCYSHDIAKAYRYAADMGAVITNNSWGYDPYSYISDNEYERYDSLIKDAIDYFEENARLEGVMEGGLSIYAAGNETTGVSDYPGAYYKYISVSAMAANYMATYYTNYGPGTNICAPGGDLYYGDEMGVLSTTIYDNSATYAWFQGTSMATPHVTGCAALAVSYAAKQGYKLTADELRTLILTSVQDINKYQRGTRPMFNEDAYSWYYGSLAAYNGQLGSGYIDAHLLLMQMDGTPCLYFRTGEESLQSLDAYFGYASKDLAYNDITISDEVYEALGIMSKPKIENGLLKIKCTKPGVGRIKVAAVIGDKIVGGGDITGGMLVEREFEIVVRGSVATNGGWL